MEQNRHTEEFNRMTVMNFRFMDARTLQCLKKDLSLSLTQAALFQIQQYFLMRERRDPAIAELRLADTVAKSFYYTPHAARVADAEGDEELLRSFRDLFRKRATLFDIPAATIPEMLEVSGAFLKHSGVYPYTDRLYCDSDAAMAARCAGKRPLLAAELPHSVAAILPDDPTPQAKRHGALLLLSPTGELPFSAEIAHFMRLAEGFSVTPLAVIGDEGLLPHLLRFDGAWLELAALDDYDAVAGPRSLNTVGKGKLLLLCDEGAVAALRGAGKRLAFIGSACPGGRFQLRHGFHMLASLELSLLRSLQPTRMTTLRAMRKKGENITPVLANTVADLLVGAEIEGDAEGALLSLAHKAFLMGAALDKSALSAALVLPAACNTATLGEAFSLVLGLHRACCELLLPLSHPRVLYCNDVQAPRLSLWLAARREKEREEIPQPKSWQQARELFLNVEKKTTECAAE